MKKLNTFTTTIFAALLMTTGNAIASDNEVVKEDNPIVIFGGCFPKLKCEKE